MMKKLVFIILILSSTLSLWAQQRPVTSTYMFNGLSLNPAYAGSLDLFSATFINRKQWINVKGAPLSQILTIHNSFKKNQIGVGLQVTRDVIGVHEETAAYGSFAYKIRTDYGILSMGLSAGIDNRKSDFTNLNLLAKDDQLLNNTPTRFTPNFGTGLYFANKNMYVGLSVPYILENNLFVLEGNVTSEAKEKRYYYLTGGMVFHFSKLIKLSPSALITVQQGNRFTFDLNATVIFENIAYLGLSYRNNDAFIFLTQLILNENLRLGYAYDATTSSLSNRSSGSHEIMINYRIKFKDSRKSPQCPVYF